MNGIPSFKKSISSVMKLWEEQEYDQALAKVDRLLKEWPGNAFLHILWASLVQLQDDPTITLDEAKEALSRAIELDRDSPSGSIELGHFLDAVEDKPRAALKAYAAGVATARRLLIEGLIGQAKALRQLDNERGFSECLLELLSLMRFESGPKGSKSEEAGTDMLFESPKGRVYVIQLKGPYAKQVAALLDGEPSNRSA